MKMNEYKIFWTTKCGEQFTNYIETENEDIGIGQAVQVLIARKDGKTCDNCVTITKWGQGGKGIAKTFGTFCLAKGLPEKIK